MTTHAPISRSPLPAAGVRGATARVAVAACLIAVTAALAALAWTARGASDVPATSLPGSGWIVALHDGSVVQRIPGEVERVLLPPWSERPTQDTLAAGEQLTSREIAYDPVRRRLWYSDTHNAVRSIDMESGAPGPFILGFADLSAPGCGLTSDARHVAIDLKHRRLVVPTLTGNVLFYSLDDMTMTGGLGVAFFGDVVYGGFRHFAIDPTSGLAWYANAQGDLVEADLERGTRTGRVIPRSRQDHGAPNAFRPLAIDPARGLLIYRTTDARFAAFDLRTLAARSELDASTADAEAITYLAP